MRLMRGVYAVLLASACFAVACAGNVGKGGTSTNEGTGGNATNVGKGGIATNWGAGAPTASPTSSSSSTPTPTPSPSPTSTSTATASPSPSPSPTGTATPSPTPTTFIAQETNTDSSQGTNGLDSCPANYPTASFLSPFQCIPVNIASATVSGTQAVNAYYTAIGYFNNATGLFTASTISFAPSYPIASGPAVPLVVQVSNLDSSVGTNGFDACPVNYPTNYYISGFQCIPINIASAVGTAAPTIGHYAVLTGSWNNTTPLFTATSVVFSSALPTNATAAVPTPAPTAAATPLALVTAWPVVRPSAQVSSITLTYSQPAQNDLMTACLLTQDSNTIATPTGWTLAQPAITNAGGLALYMFWKLAGASEGTSTTFTASAADWMSGDGAEVAGPNLTTPIAGVNSSTTTSNVSTVSGTPSVSGTLPISCFGINSASGLTSHTSGATELFTAWPSSQSGNGYVAPYNGLEGQVGPIQTGTAAYPMTATWNMTAGNGPVTSAGLMFISPQGVVVPTPGPTAAPTSTPSPSPSASATIAPDTYVEWPGTFHPFSATSIWNIQVPSACLTMGDCVASYSSDLISKTWQNSNTPAGGEGGVTGQGDTDVFFASSTDPIVTITCSGPSYQCPSSSSSEAAPSTIYIPANARPEGCSGGGDNTMQVVQPGGVAIELGYVNNCGSGTNNAWRNGDTLSVGAAGTCPGNFYTGSPGWFAVNVIASASGRCFAGGALRAAEILAYANDGVLPDHALTMGMVCGGEPGGSSWQYPAVPGSQTDFCTDGNAYGPPLGGHLWWDESPAQMASIMASNSFTITEKYIFAALYYYGAYKTDDYGGAALDEGIAGFDSESPLEFTNYTNPFGSLPDWVSHQNSSNFPTTEWTLNSHVNSQGDWDPWAGHVNTGDALDPIAHFHWVNACVARNNC
jgi:hypothetical protein